jgi:hypothetical protein
MKSIDLCVIINQVVMQTATGIVQSAVKTIKTNVRLASLIII